MEDRGRGWNRRSGRSLRLGEDECFAFGGCDWLFGEKKTNRGVQIFALEKLQLYERTNCIVLVTL
jgi:hypothetical protein